MALAFKTTNFTELKAFKEAERQESRELQCLGLPAALCSLVDTVCSAKDKIGT